MREHPILDNPVWHALGGPQTRFAASTGTLRRYDPAFTLFGAIASPADRDAIAEHLPRDAVVAIWSAEPIGTPAGLELIAGGPAVQLVADDFRPVPLRNDIRPLGPADVPAMLALVELTQPGPIAARTNELGTYLGIFEGDQLVAMAGERMHPPGYTEVSAVCTHPDFRGRGLARILSTAIVAGILARGEVPMLHTRPDNATAIATYESLGFVRRRLLQVTVLKHPGGDDSIVPAFLRAKH